MKIYNEMIDHILDLHKKEFDVHMTMEKDRTIVNLSRYDVDFSIDTKLGLLVDIKSALDKINDLGDVYASIVKINDLCDQVA